MCRYSRAKTVSAKYILASSTGRAPMFFNKVAQSPPEDTETQVTVGEKHLKKQQKVSRGLIYEDVLRFIVKLYSYCLIHR